MPVVSSVAKVLLTLDPAAEGTDADSVDGELPAEEDDCCDNRFTGACVALAAVPSGPIEFLDEGVRDLDDDRAFCVLSDELSGDNLGCCCFRISLELLEVMKIF